MLKHLRENEALVILCIEVMLVMVGFGLIMPVLPQYALDYGVNITLVGLLITAFGVSRLFLDIPVGRFTDRIGRRPVLVAGPAVMAISSLACGLAGSYGQLLVFRLLQGVGSSMMTTAGNIALADISTPANRGQTMSLYQGSLLLGAGLGPTLGGFIAEYFGMRAPFFVLAVLTLLASLVLFFRLPETRPPLREQKHPGIQSNHPRHNDGIGLKPLLRDINFITISLVTFSIFVVRTGAQNQIVPLLGSERMGLGEGQIGIALTVTNIMQVFTIFLGGKLSDKFGRKAVITPGCIISAAGLLMIIPSQSYGFLLASCAVTGLGIGIAGATPSAYVTDIVPRENYSSGMGLYRTVIDLAFIIGPVLLGWLVDVSGYTLSLLFNSALLVVAAASFHVLAREPSRRPKPAAVRQL